MADGIVRVFPDSTGARIDTEGIHIGGGVTIHRQRVRLGGEGENDLVSVTNNALDINVKSSFVGTESDTSTDPTGDGLVPLTGNNDLLTSVSVPSGNTAIITAWTWVADTQCMFTLEVRDNTTLVKIIRMMINSGSRPGDTMYFTTPIKVTGATNRSIRIVAKTINNVSSGNAHGAINCHID